MILHIVMLTWPCNAGPFTYQFYIYSAKTFCTLGASVNFCLYQEMMHLMLYIVVYRKCFVTIGRIPN